jgi:hypothetical protein
LPGLPFSDFSVTVPSSWSGAKASCTIREERSAEGAGNRMQGWKSHVLTILDQFCYDKVQCGYFRFGSPWPPGGSSTTGEDCGGLVPGNDLNAKTT